MPYCELQKRPNNKRLSDFITNTAESRNFRLDVMLNGQVFKGI